jgi:hypothetical protein
MKTSCLALITENPTRFKDLSKFDQEKERKGELFPCVEFMVNNESADFINALPSYDGHKMVYVYYLTQLRPELRSYKLICEVKNMKIFERILRKSQIN